MTGLSEGTRLRLAELIYKLPGFCWTSLACWAIFGQRSLRETRVDDACRRDTERCGACYCGKLRRSTP